MRTFSVIESFISIDGEGPMAGALAIFVRFKGCHLRCKWCDTVYAWEEGAISQEKTAQEIYAMIKASGVNHVTLTGGEPLQQEGIGDLLKLLSEDKCLTTHIETNGAIDIAPFKAAYGEENIHYIVDYKLAGSGMSRYMLLKNLETVTQQDAYKFVIAEEADLQQAYQVIKAYQLEERCQVYLSPVITLIEPRKIVDFMKEKVLNKVKCQLQLHKLIWSDTTRGV